MNPIAQGHGTARIAVAAGLLALTSLYLYAALGFSFGAWNNPRAGFMPTLAGGLGSILAAANLVRVILQERQQGNFGEQPLRAILFTAGLLVYVPLISAAGFIAATMVVLLYLIKVFGARGWVAPVSVSVIASLGIFFLFSTLLQLPLP